MSGRDILTRQALPPDRSIRYGAHPDQVIDVRQDTGAPGAPVVILVHGGFWRAEYDRVHTRPMADDLAGRGYVVCTPEYRRIGRQGGGHPGTFDDIAAAVDAILADPPATGPVVLVGHSAGGHLALWSALRHHLPATSPWQGTVRAAGTVALAAVSDLGGAIDTGLGGGAGRALLGGRLELLEETDPFRLLPYDQGHLVLVHGTEDVQVPIEISRRLAGRESSAVLVELAGVDHFALIDPRSAAWPAVIEAIGSIAGAPPPRP